MGQGLGMFRGVKRAVISTVASLALRAGHPSALMGTGPGTSFGRRGSVQGGSSVTSSLSSAGDGNGGASALVRLGVSE